MVRAQSFLLLPGLLCILLYFYPVIMRLFLIATAVVFSLATLGQNATPKQQTKIAHHQSPSSDSAKNVHPLPSDAPREPFAEVTSSTYTPAEQAQTQQTRQRWWERPSLTDWILAITTFAYAVMTAFILLAIRRESKIAQGAADAAKDGARAAEKAANAAFYSERAWIVMELINDGGGKFKLVATNYGRTPAQFIGYNVQHSYSIAEKELSPDPPKYSQSGPGYAESQPFVVPEEEWEITTFQINKAEQVGAHLAVVEAIRENVAVEATIRAVLKRPQLLIWGVVRYKDIISNAEHDTWFCQRYDERRGMFVLAGPSGYNRYT